MTPRIASLCLCLTSALPAVCGDSKIGLGGTDSGTDSNTDSTSYDPTTMTCDYEGTQHAEGATFPSSDGCATLLCSPSGIAMVDEQPSVLEGDLVVQTPADLVGLECIRQVNGSLLVGSTAVPSTVTSLELLGGLWTVSAAVIIRNNPQLTNLNGLQGLYSIGSDLIIEANATLVDTSGINPQLSLPGSVRVIDNDEITDVAGLAFLGTCNGCSQPTPPRTQLGNSDPFAASEPDSSGDALTGDPATGGGGGQLHGSLEIRGNEKLNTLSALSGLTTVWGGMIVDENPALPDLVGLEVLGQVMGDFSVRNNAALPTILAEDLLAQTAVDGVATVCGNLNGLACP